MGYAYAHLHTRPLQVAYAEYELDAIMLTGSCTEYAPGKQLPPPKGLELNLGAEQQPHMVRGADAGDGVLHLPVSSCPIARQKKNERGLMLPERGWLCANSVSVTVHRARIYALAAAVQSCWPAWSLDGHMQACWQLSACVPFEGSSLLIAKRQRQWCVVV